MLKETNYRYDQYPFIESFSKKRSVYSTECFVSVAWFINECDLECVDRVLDRFSCPTLIEAVLTFSHSVAI